MNPKNLEISVQNITKSFDGREILRDVSFNLPPGSVLGYLGPNGAGKTTTIRIILGLIRPDKGKVFVNEWTAGADSALINRYFGVALETPALYRHLSVRDNLLYCGRLRKMELSVLKVRVPQMLECFGLERFANTSAGKISKGMSQKLSLARAFLHSPRILILDEPTDGLDPAARRQVKDHILNLVRGENCTVLLASHNLPEVEELCDHLVFLRNGQVLLQGRTNDILQKAGHPAVRVGMETNEEALQAKSILGVLPFVENIHTDDCDLVIRLNGGIRDVGRLLNRYNIPFLTLGEDTTSLEGFYLSIMKEEK